MIFKKDDHLPEGPQQVVVTWGNQEQQEAIQHSSLFRVAIQVTEIWFAHSKKAESIEEIVATYAKAYELLEDWYRGTPQKEEIQKILDTIYPEPPGMEPGETLLPREQEAPPLHLVEYYKKRQKKK